MYKFIYDYNIYLLIFLVFMFLINKFTINNTIVLFIILLISVGVLFISYVKLHDNKKTVDHDMLANDLNKTTKEYINDIEMSNNNEKPNENEKLNTKLDNVIESKSNLENISIKNNNKNEEFLNNKFLIPLELQQNVLEYVGDLSDQIKLSNLSKSHRKYLKIKCFTTSPKVNTKILNIK